MLDNVILNLANNNAVLVSILGLLAVFLGLVILSVSTAFINKWFEWKARKSGKPIVQEDEGSMLETNQLDSEQIHPDHLVAIFTAIELYRRLHYEAQISRITFIRGQESINGWKMGSRINQGK
jgi:hypothetical protein